VPVPATRGQDRAYPVTHPAHRCCAPPFDPCGHSVLIVLTLGEAARITFHPAPLLLPAAAPACCCSPRHVRRAPVQRGASAGGDVRPADLHPVPAGVVDEDWVRL